MRATSPAASCLGCGIGRPSLWGHEREVGARKNEGGSGRFWQAVVKPKGMVQTKVPYHERGKSSKPSIIVQYVLRRGGRPPTWNLAYITENNVAQLTVDCSYPRLGW